MDHLPTVADPVARPIEFPYHGGEYQSLSFDAYPASHGVTAGELLNGDAPGAKSHLETWFYFGMLSEVLGPVNQNHFLCAGTGGDRILTTSRLEEYNLSWWKKLKARSAKEKKDGLLKAHRCNKFVFERLNFGRCSITIKELLGPRFVLAIQLLGSSLSHAVATFAAERTGWHQKLPSREFLVPWFPTSPYVDAKMLEAGWCPNEVERFKKMISPFTQVYALGLRRPVRLKHDSCTPFECFANNVDNATYQTAHVSSECQCQFLAVDVDAVKRILEKEIPGIPLVEIRRKAGSGIELKVVEYQWNKRYVAVSHVWSDGMGNSNHNALPLCQLTQLLDRGGPLLRDSSHMALSSDDRVNPFVLGAAHLWHAAPIMLGVDKGATTIWIDTLCVPLEEKPRKIAIRGMKDAYEKAHRVMVLDSELLLVDHVTKEESMLRIETCSGWTRRLWTLQEGVFARQRAYVFFKNTAVRVPYIVDRLSVEHARGNFPRFSEPVIYSSYSPWLAEYRMLQEALSPFSRLEKSLLKDPTLDPSYLIAVTWSNIMNRTTSKEADRPVIMASLLGLDTAKVLEVPAKPFITETGEAVLGGPIERMRQVYKLMPEFPQSVIFQRGERFHEDGWRWAVTSCRRDAGGDQTQGRLNDTPGRIRLPHGLLVNFPGLIVRRQDVSEATPFDSDIPVHFPLLQVNDHTLRGCIFIDLSSLDFTKVREHASYGIGLLLNSQKKTPFWEQVFESDVQTTRQLVVVSVYKEEKSTLYSRYEGRVTAWRNRRAGGWIHSHCKNAELVDGRQGWWVG